MFKFKFTLKLNERVVAKCSRHPRYNPDQDGYAAIKGGCSTCIELYDLYRAKVDLEKAVRVFLKSAGPWTKYRKLHQSPATISTSNEPTNQEAVHALD